MIKDDEDFNLKMEQILSNMNKKDQMKLAFARYFLNKIQVYDIEAGRIHLEPMDVKTFQYFIFSIILEYHSYIEGQGAQGSDKKIVTRGRNKSIRKPNK